MEQEDRPARLFQCSNASGSFRVEEITDFTQMDLVPEDVFLLDTYDSIYIWVGTDSRPEEKTMASDAAIVSYKRLYQVFMMLCVSGP